MQNQVIDNTALRHLEGVSERPLPLFSQSMLIFSINPTSHENLQIMRL